MTALQLVGPARSASSTSSRSASFLTLYSPRICLTSSSESETTSTSSTPRSSADSRPGDAGRCTRRRCSSPCRSPRRARRAPSRPRPRARSRTRPAPGCRASRRRSRAAPSRERVEVERRLLVRVRLPQRRDDLGLALLRVDRLEPQLGDALLAPRLRRCPATSLRRRGTSRFPPCTRSSARSRRSGRRRRRRAPRAAGRAPRAERRRRVSGSHRHPKRREPDGQLLRRYYTPALRPLRAGQRLQPWHEAHQQRQGRPLAAAASSLWSSASR